MSKIQHFAFKSEYPDLSLRLITEVEIYDVSPSPQKVKVKALWDTGAMLSASNGAGKTLFTFAMPPFEEKTDLYERSVKAVP